MSPSSSSSPLTTARATASSSIPRPEAGEPRYLEGEAEMMAEGVVLG